jgi:hypothetical protein
LVVAIVVPNKGKNKNQIKLYSILKREDDAGVIFVASGNILGRPNKYKFWKVSPDRKE